MRTPRGVIKSALRLLWLRSKERSTALKSSEYHCEECGVKQSDAKGKEVKLEVHHMEEEIDWDKIVEYLQLHLLCEPEKLEVLCKECHYKRHGREHGRNTRNKKS